MYGYKIFGRQKSFKVVEIWYVKSEERKVEISNILEIYLGRNKFRNVYLNEMAYSDSVFFLTKKDPSFGALFNIFSASGRCKLAWNHLK